MTPKKRVLAGLAVHVVAVAVAVALALTFPEVKGLGAKVRLPVFHGALTWVNLAAFVLLGLAAILSLATRREDAYRWEEAFRWVSIPMWLVGSGLGFLAAMNTWDFTGSKSSRWSIVSADPRLMAQFWVLLAGLAVIAIGLMFEDRKLLSAVDLGFVVVSWVWLMRAILGPGRALHPDSPVLNSDELRIKLLFFGIVAALSVAMMAATWSVKTWRGRGKSDDAQQPLAQEL